MSADPKNPCPDHWMEVGGDGENGSEIMLFIVYSVLKLQTIKCIIMAIIFVTSEIMQIDV